jgi:hypothetical protein
LLAALRGLLVLACALLALASPSPAEAQTLEIEAFGHRVTITDGPDATISVDGRAMYRNAQLGVEKQLRIKGMGVLVGSASTGAATCDRAPFIIAFPKGGPPRFDGLVDVCTAPTTTVSETDILFETRATVGQPGERWRWTPEGGLRLEGTVAHVATSSGGWDALRSKTLDHPHDLLDYRPFAELLRHTLGEQWDNVAPALPGPGAMAYEGDLAVGHACEPHACDERAVLVVADTARERLFIAWFWPESDSVFSNPPIETWSEEARRAFDRWLGADPPP